MTELSEAETERYARHLILPEIGPKGQAKLKSASILCIGAGGLGSSLLYYLTAAGIEHITLIDCDTVALSNLQRQILHTEADLHRTKTDSAQEKLMALNPQLSLTLHTDRWTAALAQKLAPGHTLIIDATDNFASRDISNRIALREKIPFIYGAISGFSGQASTFAPWLGGGCYRCMLPTLPEPQAPPGVVGAVAGMIGCAQVAEAIKYITGSGDLLLGKLFHIDTLSFKSGLLKLKRNPLCPCCSKLG